MIKPGFGYFRLPQKPIPDKQDFYKSGIKEAPKVRNLITTAIRLFVTNDKNIELILVGDDNYKVNVYSSGVNKYLICTLYYITKEQRLDIFDGSDPNTPTYVWIRKNCVMKNVPNILTAVKAETVFLPLISAL